MPPRLAGSKAAAKQEGRSRKRGAPPRSRGTKKKSKKAEQRTGRRQRLTRRSAKARARPSQDACNPGELSGGGLCPICQEAYSSLSFPVVHAPCGHVACATCSLTWQKKKSSRTCALCRTPVLSIAHCALLEQLLQPPAQPASSSSEPLSEPARGSTEPPPEPARGSAETAIEPSRAEIKRGLQELSQGDLNFIPGDYRAHLVRGASLRAVRKGDLTMLETCLRDLKARASTKLLCEVAGLWKKEPRPALSLLLAHGGKLDGHGENRPLLHAVYLGNLPMLSALIEMRADPALTGCGDSALHVAVRRGRPDIVRLLLAKGVKADEPDAAGRTAHLLAEMGWRMHVMACNRQRQHERCPRCQARWEVRCQLFEQSSSSPQARLPQTPEESWIGANSESEDSSSQWEETESDVSDMDDWLHEDEESEDESEEEEEEEPDEEPQQQAPPRRRRGRRR